MQGTFIGFNTAGITFEERFLALLLKVKKENGFCEIYYLQAPVLADLPPDTAEQNGCDFPAA